MLDPRRALRLAPLLTVVAVAPLVAGCSTLGIAQVEDMDAMNRRLTNANTATNQRVDTEVQELNTRLDTMNTQLETMNTDLETVETRLQDYREFVEDLDLAGISGQADRAANAANRAEQHFDDLLAQYLRRLRADQAALAEEIQEIESKLERSRAKRQSGAAPATAPADAGAGSGGDEELPEIPTGG